MERRDTDGERRDRTGREGLCLSPFLIVLLTFWKIVSWVTLRRTDGWRRVLFAGVLLLLFHP